MIHSHDELNAFRHFEFNGWQQSADQYDYSFGSLTRQSIEPLLDSVNARSQMRILDIATGPGYVAHRAQQRGCQVVGIDFSDAMVVKARSKSAGIEFVKGDAECLPFNDCKFEAAVMNFGLLHFARPQKAICQAFRVIQNKGRFGFTVWSKPEESVAFKILLQAINDYGNTNIGLPNGPPFFYYSDAIACALALEGAGFSNIETKIIPMEWELRSQDEFFEAFYKGSARNGGLLRAQTPQALKNIKNSLTQSLSAYVKENKLILPMSSILASAQKPELK
jgi:SAM-dependent methyltransferase